MNFVPSKRYAEVLSVHTSKSDLICNHELITLTNSLDVTKILSIKFILGDLEVEWALNTI